MIQASDQSISVKRFCPPQHIALVQIAVTESARERVKPPAVPALPEVQAASPGAAALPSATQAGPAARSGNTLPSRMSGQPRQHVLRPPFPQPQTAQFVQPKLARPLNLRHMPQQGAGVVGRPACPLIVRKVPNPTTFRLRASPPFSSSRKPSSCVGGHHRRRGSRQFARQPAGHGHLGTEKPRHRLEKQRAEGGGHTRARTLIWLCLTSSGSGLRGRSCTFSSASSHASSCACPPGALPQRAGLRCGSQRRFGPGDAARAGRSVGSRSQSPVFSVREQVERPRHLPAHGNVSVSGNLRKSPRRRNRASSALQEAHRTPAARPDRNTRCPKPLLLWQAARPRVKHAPARRVSYDREDGVAKRV